ncbi:MAG: TetR/AcrR family transcriptional regulator, partial [Candidatus Binatia bacterium]
RTSRKPPRSRQVGVLAPRKAPRQERAKANVEAIVDAAAHLLRERGWAALTTNHIAARAGVSIGTLYQFFPGKEAVVAALAERTIRRHFEAVIDDLPSALARKTPEEALTLLVRRIVAMLAADRRLYAVLLREVPFLRSPASSPGPVDALAGLVSSRLAPLFPNETHAELEIESWLVGRMTYEAIVALAIFDEAPADLDRATEAFLRLLLRMLGRRGASRASSRRSSG